MLKGIVGVSLAITRLEGKVKLSQNRPEADRAGVVAGLRRDGRPDIAALVAAAAEPPVA
jgi:transcriptional regulator